MRMPQQSKPVARKMVTTKIAGEVSPSVDWMCLISCAGALAQCATSSDPAQCLISAGMGKCVKCL